MQGEKQIGVVFLRDQGAFEVGEVDVGVAGEDDGEAAVFFEDGLESLRDHEVVFLLGADARVGASVDAAVPGVDDDDDLSVLRDVRGRPGSEQAERQSEKQRGEEAGSHGF